LSENERKSLIELEKLKDEYKNETIEEKENEIKEQENIINVVTKKLSGTNVKPEIIETEKKKQTEAELKIKELQEAIEKLKEL